jgi:hypothetical protein
MVVALPRWVATGERGAGLNENLEQGSVVYWLGELRPYSTTNDRFNPGGTKPDRWRWRCRSPGRGPREHAKHYWPGRSIRPHSNDWLYDNSVRWDARKQGRVAARGCDHPIRCYYDEQYAPDRSYPAAVNDFRERWGSAGFSNGHNHWNGLHPAVWLYIREQFATDNSDSDRLACESSCPSSRQGNRNRGRDAHVTDLSNRGIAVIP